jgi:LPXTG-motif cell wall-anchored protein
MKRTIAGGLLAAVTLLGGLALTNGSAAAIVDDQSEQEVCYETEKFAEYLYERPTYGDVIEKETRTRRWVDEVPSKWWVWSPNKDQGPFDGPPAFPDDERGTWQGPKINGGPDQDTYGTFNVSNGDNGRSSWFHRSVPVPGYWGDWGPWTDWPGAGPVNDDGRDRGPLPHGEGKGWQRQYRYVVVGQFENGTEQYGWTEEGPTKEGWTLIDQRDSEREVEVECPPPPTTEPPATTQPPVTTQPPTTAPPTTAPPTTAPPTTAPPETTQPPVVVTTVPPTIPPTVAPTAPPPPPATPTALPETGAETWMIAIIAGLLSMAGLGAMRLARRGS